MRSVILLVAFVLSSFTDVVTQQLPVQPGQRVRITAPDLGVNKQAATFGSLDGGVLTLSTADSTMQCPIAAVTRLDVHRGRGVNMTRSVAMSLGGLALGAGIGWGIGKAIDESCDATLCLDLAQGWGLALGAAIGFVAGSTAGALIKSDIWEEVPLDRLRVSVVPQREGFGIGARIAF